MQYAYIQNSQHLTRWAFLSNIHKKSTVFGLEYLCHQTGRTILATVDRPSSCPSTSVFGLERLCHQTDRTISATVDRPSSCRSTSVFGLERHCHQTGRTISVTVSRPSSSCPSTMAWRISVTKLAGQSLSQSTGLPDDPQQWLGASLSPNW